MLFLTTTLISCKTSNDEKTFDPDANLDYDNMIYDDFTSGLNKDIWFVGNSTWGTNNNGVKWQNVLWTDDGNIAIRALGNDYSGDVLGNDGVNPAVRSGGKISTRQPLGPGRYEVRMKVLPRFGSTTAMWTYAFEDGQNHEIDIELNVNDSFYNIWTTNWTTVEDYDHREVETDILNNDGEFHTYKFEWHTNPERVDYYVDDILIHTSYANIPTIAGQFNIGNWFPTWAGLPDFEVDYTIIDWFRYTPYLNNPYEAREKKEASIDEWYPSEQVTLPKPNLLSNFGFEYANEAWKKDLFSEVTILDNAGINQSRALEVPANDITYQHISGMDESFVLKFSAYVKFDPETSDGGSFLFEFKPSEEKVLGRKTITIDTSNANYVGNGYYLIEDEIELVEDTKRIEFSIIGGTKGSIFIDDIFLNKK